MSKADVRHVEAASASWLELGEMIGTSVRRIADICSRG